MFSRTFDIRITWHKQNITWEIGFYFDDRMGQNWLTKAGFCQIMCSFFLIIPFPRFKNLGRNKPVRECEHVNFYSMLLILYFSKELLVVRQTCELLPELALSFVFSILSSICRLVWPIRT